MEFKSDVLSNNIYAESVNTSDYCGFLGSQTSDLSGKRQYVLPPAHRLIAIWSEEQWIYPRCHNLYLLNIDQFEFYRVNYVREIGSKQFAFEIR